MAVATNPLKLKGTGDATSTKNQTNIGSTTSDITALTQALAEQYNAEGYAARDFETRRAQAGTELESKYSALSRAARQQAEAGDLRMEQQKAAIAEEYDKNRQSAAMQTAKSYSATDNQLLSRGMQRSSYGAQTLSDVLASGAAQQADINRSQTRAISDIEAQRTQLSNQLNETLAGYEREKASDTLARAQQMEEQDYQRGAESRARQTNIAQQLYSNMYQAQRDTTADAQWLQQFNENVRQFNLQKSRDAKDGMISGAGTNTPADSYYQKTYVEKKAEPAPSSGGGGGGGGAKKPKTDASGEKSLLDVLTGTKTTSSAGGAEKMPAAGTMLPNKRRISGATM